MKMLIFIFISLIISFQAHAGRYDGLTEVFNKAAKNIDPPPPRDLNLNYNAPGFDPPGLHGPTVNTPPPPSPIPPRHTLTDEFNMNNR